MQAQSISWTTPQAARIARVSYRMADYWIKTRLVVPSIAGARGHGWARRFAFRNLLTLRAVAFLREQGVSLQAIRKVQRQLDGYSGDDDALATARLVVVTRGRGRYDVLLALDDDALAVSMLRDPGQVVARVVLELAPIYRDVRTGIQREARKASKQRKGIKQADAKVAAA